MCRSQEQKNGIIAAVFLFQYSLLIPLMQYFSPTVLVAGAGMLLLIVAFIIFYSAGVALLVLFKIDVLLMLFLFLTFLVFLFRYRPNANISCAGLFWRCNSVIKCAMCRACTISEMHTPYTITLDLIGNAKFKDRIC